MYDKNLNNSAKMKLLSAQSCKRI